MVNAYYTSLFKDVECEMTTIGNYAERIYSGGTPTTSNAAYWGGTFGWFSSGETRNRFVISTEKALHKPASTIHLPNSLRNTILSWPLLVRVLRGDRHPCF